LLLDSKATLTTLFKMRNKALAPMKVLDPSPEFFQKNPADRFTKE
jgi:hypothetical protein